jgi:hypothetical protein
MKTGPGFPKFPLAVLLTAVLALSCQDTTFRGKTEPASDPGQLYRHYANQSRYNLDVAQQYDLALLYADSMLLLLHPYATQKEYNLQYAEAHLYKGDVLFRLKRYDEACFYFYQGQKSILPTADSCTSSTFLSLQAFDP